MKTRAFVLRLVAVTAAILVNLPACGEHTTGVAGLHLEVDSALGDQKPTPTPVLSSRAGALSPRRAPAPRVSPGHDFGPEARALSKLLLCEDGARDKACRRLARYVRWYRRKHLKPLTRWFADNRGPLPAGRPLLYPFSGGDLANSLAVFPEPPLRTHLSLEQVGPPNPLAKLTQAQRRYERRGFLRVATDFLRNRWSYTTVLSDQEHKRLGGILPLWLIALRLHGATITGLRYFRVAADGGLKWIERQDQDRRARSLHKRSRRLRFDGRFSNAEIRFRLPGRPGEMVVRHIAGNLSNKGLRRNPGLRAYLAGQAPHALMLKASSRLLRLKYFTDARDLLFARATHLVSDAINAPRPRWLRDKGFTLRLFGRFRCGNMGKKWISTPWIREYRKAKPRPPLVPMKYGYQDCRRASNVVIARTQSGSRVAMRRRNQSPSTSSAVQSPR